MTVKQVIEAFKNFKTKKQLKREVAALQDSLDLLNGAIEDDIFYSGCDAFIARLRQELTPQLAAKDFIRWDDIVIGPMGMLVWTLLVLMYGDFKDIPADGRVTDVESAKAHLQRWREMTEGL